MENIESRTDKMKVEVWSDVMCPFCYIGKRRFENALKDFEHGNNIEIEWKAFQLDPSIPSNTGQTVNEYLAARKGIPSEHAAKMNAHVTAMAAELGLRYKLDTAVVANSFDAHRLAHLAKEKGRGDETTERIFKAYFEESKDIADHQTLTEIGILAGLDRDELVSLFNSDHLKKEVKKDLEEGSQLGIQGVPFFVLDRAYAVSGAQPTDIFRQALERAYENWRGKTNFSIVASEEGETCRPGDDCQ